MRTRTHKVGAEGGWDEAGPFSLKGDDMTTAEVIERAAKKAALGAWMVDPERRAKVICVTMWELLDELGCLEVKEVPQCTTGP